MRRHVRDGLHPRDSRYSSIQGFRLFSAMWSAKRGAAEADADLVCQPGVLWMDVNATLAEKGALKAQNITLLNVHLTLT